MTQSSVPNFWIFKIIESCMLLFFVSFIVFLFPILHIQTLFYTTNPLTFPDKKSWNIQHVEKKDTQYFKSFVILLINEHLNWNSKTHNTSLIFPSSLRWKLPMWETLDELPISNYTSPFYPTILLLYKCILLFII